MWFLSQHFIRSIIVSIRPQVKLLERNMKNCDYFWWWYCVFFSLKKLCDEITTVCMAEQKILKFDIFTSPFSSLLLLLWNWLHWTHWRLNMNIDSWPSDKGIFVFVCFLFCLILFWSFFFSLILNERVI